MTIKLPLKKLEHNLGYKLQENTICVAVDTATKSGIATVFVKADKVIIETFILKIPAIPKDLEDKNEKYEAHLRLFSELFDAEFLKSLDKIPHLNNQTQKLLVLENSFLKINVVTFGFLRALQGIIYEKLHKKFNTTKLFFPVTARKIVGFQSTLPKGTASGQKKKEIMRWISNVVEDTIKDDNEADALLLAFAGLKKE